MVKESLIAILKVANCYIIIPPGQDFVAGWYLRTRYDARCGPHCYGDAIRQKGILWRTHRDETSQIGGQKRNGILGCFRLG